MSIWILIICLHVSCKVIWITIFSYPWGTEECMWSNKTLRMSFSWTIRILWDILAGTLTLMTSDPQICPRLPFLYCRCPLQVLTRAFFSSWKTYSRADTIPRMVKFQPFLTYGNLAVKYSYRTGIYQSWTLSTLGTVQKSCDPLRGEGGGHQKITNDHRGVGGVPEKIT